MEPRFTIEQTNVLKLDAYPRTTQTNDFLGQAAGAEAGAVVISLQDALEIGG